MISDSIPNASVAMASSNHKDFAKKKRGNRWAKLKQCKLDARREQWLSQVKNKGLVNGGGVIVHVESERGQPIGKLVKPRGGEDGIYGDGTSVHHYSDSESWPSNSPTSHVSSILGSNVSGVNFTESSRSESSNSIRGSSSSSNGFCSEDEGDGCGDDDCLDDWEAVADALAATDNKHQEDAPDAERGLPPSGKCGSDSRLKVASRPCSGVDKSSKKGGMPVHRASGNMQAWRPDDTSRPHGLPNLSKQYSFPLNSERRLGHAGSVWGGSNVGLVPTSCPICYEDFDCTDSSFLPCPCGFKLCLFCHKRILEQDSRCPGCRKQYDSDPLKGEAILDGGGSTYRFARSCSMITRF